MNPEEKAKQLAEAHWTYIRDVINCESAAGDDEAYDISRKDYLAVLKFHYTTAMIHGYKHGVADSQGEHKCACAKPTPSENKRYEGFYETHKQGYGQSTPFLFHDFQVKVLQWAQERKLLSEGTPQGQYVKLVEEVKELGEALDTSNHEATIDAIGDITVVLIILSYLGNTTVTSCLAGAYNEIKDRTGRMIAGTFVKD